MPEIDQPSVALGGSAAAGLPETARLVSDIVRLEPGGRLQTVESSLSTGHVGGPGRLVQSKVRSVTPLPGLTCEDVDDLLEPSAWSDLSDGRLSLRPIDGGDGGDRLVPDGPARHYRETFLLAPGLVLRPVLTFARRTLGDEDGTRGRALEYRLASHPDQSRMVLVDEGSVIVHESPEGLTIRTTKRLRFAPPFDGPAFAATADLAGYDEANAATIQAALHQASWDDLLDVAVAQRAATGDELTAEQFGTHLVSRFVDQGAAATASWLAGTAAAWTSSFELAMSGGYTADRLKADVDQAWSRYVGLVSSLVGPERV